MAEELLPILCLSPANVSLGMPDTKCVGKSLFLVSLCSNWDMSLSPQILPSSEYKYCFPIMKGGVGGMGQGLG